MLDYLIQLTIYIFIAAITPGPNNTIAFYNSFNFGIKKSIHLPFAAALGAGFIQLLCCFGLGTIIVQIPLIQKFLKFIGFLYLIYLAYQISKFRLKEDKKIQKKIGFFELLSFQFINPKLYIFATTTSVIFTNYNYNFILESLIIAFIMSFLTLISIFIWIFTGGVIINFFKNPFQRTLINYFLSLCLLLTAIWIVFT